MPSLICHSQARVRGTQGFIRGWGNGGIVTELSQVLLPLGCASSGSLSASLSSSPLPMVGTPHNQVPPDPSSHLPPQRPLYSYLPVSPGHTGPFLPQAPCPRPFYTELPHLHGGGICPELLVSSAPHCPPGWRATLCIYTLFDNNSCPS